MTRLRWKLLGWICLFLGVCGRLTAAENETPVSAVELNDGECLVFLGDSITHQCLYTQYVEDFFYTRFPQLRAQFHNAGVGGAKAWDALQRFDQDVAAYKPKYVTVLLGMNDGQYQPYNEEIFKTYRRDMTQLIDRIQDLGATPVLMTPTMYDARAARMARRKRDPESVVLYNSVLAYYGSWLREVAVESGHGFVDMYSPLNSLTLAQRKTDANFTLISDAVHPDAAGQMVMAAALLEDMGLRRPVSSIRILPGRGDNPMVRSTGGKVTNLKMTDEGLEFTWSAESLPYAVPSEAQAGAELLKLGHRFSREALEIHVLPEARYELSIDGEVIGQYTAVSLARHVELQGKTNTPQYQQALQVAELNKERNAGPVRALRNEWRTFQQFARLQARLAETPDNEDLQKQVTQLEERLEGLEQRIAGHRQAARQLEDRVFEINQPQPRKFALRRVSRGIQTGRN